MLKNIFRNILIGAAFYCNGNYCIKRSSMTADVYREPDGEYLGWFYFKWNDVCTNKHQD